jgi:hypothetical protein
VEGTGVKKTTNGFASPNYTQTPNDFFDLIPDMEDSELRVTIVMIRNTFGYHRPGFRMSIAQLAAAAGLSENGAKAGAKAAEERGTFYRVNPNSLKTAEWALVVDGSPIDPPAADGSASDPLPGHPLSHRFLLKKRKKLKKMAFRRFQSKMPLPLDFLLLKKC